MSTYTQDVSLEPVVFTLSQCECVLLNKCLHLGTWFYLRLEVTLLHEYSLLMILLVKIPIKINLISLRSRCGMMVLGTSQTSLDTYSIR